MENPNHLSPNVNRPFLLNWIVANIVGLPILLGSYGVGLFLLMGLAILSDGGSVPPIWYVFISIILALSGAVMGAYLGFMQSLPLKTRIPQSGKWIGATSLGVAIGAPLSWLVYRWIFDSPLLDRANGLFFFFLYQYITFGVLLGLSVGAAQWFVLKQQVHRAGLWIVALPILFTGGMAFTKVGFLYLFFMRSVHQLMQTITNQSLEIEFPALAMRLFFDIMPSLIALVAVSLLTGVVLERLFQFSEKQSGAQ